MAQVSTNHTLSHAGLFGEGPADRRARLRNMLVELGTCIIVVCLVNSVVMMVTVFHCHPQWRWGSKLARMRSHSCPCQDRSQRCAFMPCYRAMEWGPLPYPASFPCSVWIRLPFPLQFYIDSTAIFSILAVSGYKYKLQNSLNSVRWTAHTVDALLTECSKNTANHCT